MEKIPPPYYDECRGCEHVTRIGAGVSDEKVEQIAQTSRLDTKKRLVLRVGCRSESLGKKTRKMTFYLYDGDNRFGGLVTGPARVTCPAK